MIWLYLVIIALMIVLSAFFSGSEMAFNSANKMRLRHAAEENKRKTAKTGLAGDGLMDVPARKANENRI